MQTFSFVLASLTISLLLSGCKHASVSVAGSRVTASHGWSEATAPFRLSNAESNAAEPAVAVSKSGEVFIVWVNHLSKQYGDVMIGRLSSEGQLQGPVRVNTQPGIATAWRGDPPTIAVAPNGSVFVGWTGREGSDSGHNTSMYLSASHDEGRTFTQPTKVNDDSRPGPHGMHSLAIGNDGGIHVAWLDERNVTKKPRKDTKASGHHMENNRDLFVSSSFDGGKSFAANQSVATEVCPCCKTAMTIDSDGRVYLSWRQVLPGDFRHIAVASLASGAKSFGDPVIVSDDQWMIKGCPVSGPALSVGRGNALRVTWYTGFENGTHGIFWSESRDAGRTFSPRQLLHGSLVQGTPALATDPEGPATAVWETIENGVPQIMAVALEGNDQGEQKPGLVGSGQLPAAVISGNQLVVVSVVPEGEKKAIWLLRAQRVRP